MRTLKLQLTPTPTPTEFVEARVILGTPGAAGKVYLHQEAPFCNRVPIQDPFLICFYDVLVRVPINSSTAG